MDSNICGGSSGISGWGSSLHLTTFGFYPNTRYSTSVPTLFTSKMRKRNFLIYFLIAQSCSVRHFVRVWMGLGFREWQQSSEEADRRSLLLLLQAYIVYLSAFVRVRLSLYLSDPIHADLSNATQNFCLK